MQIMMGMGLTTSICKKAFLLVFKWDTGLTESLTYCLILLYKQYYFYLNTHENAIFKQSRENTKLIRSLGYICLRENVFTSVLFCLWQGL